MRKYFVQKLHFSKISKPPILTDHTQHFHHGERVPCHHSQLSHQDYQIVQNQNLRLLNNNNHNNQIDHHKNLLIVHIKYHNNKNIGHLFVPNLNARIINEKGGYYINTNSLGFRSDIEFKQKKMQVKVSFQKKKNPWNRNSGILLITNIIFFNINRSYFLKFSYGLYADFRKKYDEIKPFTSAI